MTCFTFDCRFIIIFAAAKRLSLPAKSIRIALEKHSREGFFIIIVASGLILKI